jgi:hypothetical protein
MGVAPPVRVEVIEGIVVEFEAGEGSPPGESARTGVSLGSSWLWEGEKREQKQMKKSNQPRVRAASSLRSADLPRSK